MKACVYKRYGGPEVLAIDEVPAPTPKADELLIRVHATTVTMADHRIRALDLPTGFGVIARLIFGVRAPRKAILGTELAGVVTAVGDRVTKFQVGQRVFAFPGATLGCHAEYKCVSQDGPVASIPDALGFDEAAALSFGGATALDFLRRGQLQANERILINGASGAVGSAAVQLAKHLGAHVTGVCSGANAALVKSLGADEVIDYTTHDFAENGQRYDVIMDAVGNAPYARCKRSLTEHGRLLLVVAGLPELLSAPWASITSSRRVVAGPVPERAEDLRALAELATAGKYRPVIEHRFAFEDIAAAHRLVDTGRKKGNVVVIVHAGEGE